MGTVTLGFPGSLAAGLLTAVGALPVLFGRSTSDRLNDILLSFAAGAMLYVISHEIVPETHSHGYENEATFGLTIGMLVMMFLDIGFG